MKKGMRPLSGRTRIVHQLPGERLECGFARVVRRKKPDPPMPSRKSSTVKSLSRGTLEWDIPTRAGSQRSSCWAPGGRLKHSVRVVRRKKPDPPKPSECNPNKVGPPKDLSPEELWNGGARRSQAHREGWSGPQPGQETRPREPPPPRTDCCSGGDRSGQAHREVPAGPPSGRHASWGTPPPSGRHAPWGHPSGQAHREAPWGDPSGQAHREVPWGADWEQAQSVTSWRETSKRREERGERKKSKENQYTQNGGCCINIQNGGK